MQTFFCFKSIFLAKMDDQYEKNWQKSSLQHFLEIKKAASSDEDGL
jgi:hypothetical protein